MPAPSPQTLFVAPGLLVARIAPILAVYQGAEVTDADFERMMTEVEKAIASRAPHEDFGLFYHFPVVKQGNAMRRRMSAEMLRRQAPVLARPKAAMAIVTDSVLVQGIVRAVWWVAPPPCPHVVAGDEPAALAHLAQHLPSVDRPAHLAAYRALRRANEARLGGR